MLPRIATRLPAAAPQDDQTSFLPATDIDLLVRDPLSINDPCQAYIIRWHGGESQSNLWPENSRGLSFSIEVRSLTILWCLNI